MFTQLLTRYRLRAAKMDPAQALAFQTADDDVKKRKEHQDTLLRKMSQKRGRAQPDAALLLQKRIDLITEQKKFTQGKQELELDKRELQYLIGRVRADATVNEGVRNARLQNTRGEQQLTERLAQVDARLLALEREKLQLTLARAEEQTAATPIPDAPQPLDPAKHTGGALAKQQQNLLAMQAAAPTLTQLQAAFAKAPSLAPGGLQTIAAQVATLTATLATAERLLAAHALAADRGADPAAATTLGQRATAFGVRLQALGVRLSQAQAATNPFTAGDRFGTVGMTALATLSQEIPAFAAEQQQAVQKAQTTQIKAREKAAQLAVVGAAVDQLIVEGAPADATAFVKKLLADAPGPLLVQLRKGVPNATGLAAAVAAHEKKKELEALLKMLANVKENDVVQGFFLLAKAKGAKGEGPKPKYELGAPKDSDDRNDHRDTQFFAMTQSAQGDYNKPDNIGKYTYHVTALANILRGAGKGISVSGLSPGQGGLSGGSCEIADDHKDFHGVNIKDASVVNSQNKVAASSNRDAAMKVYIAQREKHVEDEMKGGRADKAAQGTAIMLRFPIRAEYLGKFGKDPIHLTDNLELLDGTPVPPADIEVLVHREWVGMTDSKMIESFKAMFADMIAAA